MRQHKFDRKIAETMKKFGLTYEIKTGQKHRKLFVNNTLIMVYSNNSFEKDQRFLEKIIKNKFFKNNS